MAESRSKTTLQDALSVPTCTNYIPSRTFVEVSDRGGGVEDAAPHDSARMGGRAKDGEAGSDGEFEHGNWGDRAETIRRVAGAPRPIIPRRQVGSILG